MGAQSRRNDTDTITVTQSGDWYVATDESSGVASQGKTKVQALENLADALQLHIRPDPSDSEEDLEPPTAPWLSE